MSRSFSFPSTSEGWSNAGLISLHESFQEKHNVQPTLLISNLLLMNALVIQLLFNIEVM